MTNENKKDADNRWFIKKDHRGKLNFSHIVNEFGHYICEVCGIDGLHKEKENHAHLIAAAPQMLEALEMCLIKDGKSAHFSSLEKKIIAAIAKAKGNPEKTRGDYDKRKYKR